MAINNATNEQFYEPFHGPSAEPAQQIVVNTNNQTVIYPKHEWLDFTKWDNNEYENCPIRKIVQDKINQNIPPTDDELKLYVSSMYCCYYDIPKKFLTDNVCRHALFARYYACAIKDMKNACDVDWKNALVLDSSLIIYAPMKYRTDDFIRCALEHHAGFGCSNLILRMENPTDNDWISALSKNGMLYQYLPLHLKTDTTRSLAIRAPNSYTHAIYHMENPADIDWCRALVNNFRILKNLPHNLHNSDFVSLCNKIKPEIGYYQYKYDLVDNKIVICESVNKDMIYRSGNDFTQCL